MNNLFYFRKFVCLCTRYTRVRADIHICILCMHLWYTKVYDILVTYLTGCAALAMFRVQFQIEWLCMLLCSWEASEHHFKPWHTSCSTDQESQTVMPVGDTFAVREGSKLAQKFTCLLSIYRSSIYICCGARSLQQYAKFLQWYDVRWTWNIKRFTI